MQYMQIYVCCRYFSFNFVCGRHIFYSIFFSHLSTQSQSIEGKKQSAKNFTVWRKKEYNILESIRSVCSLLCACFVMISKEIFHLDTLALKIIGNILLPCFGKYEMCLKFWSWEKFWSCFSSSIFFLVKWFTFSADDVSFYVDSDEKEDVFRQLDLFLR